MKNKETLEEVAERLFPINTKDESLNYQNSVRKGNFIQGAKWQQEQNKNLYSEDDLKKYGEFCVAKFNGFESVSLNDSVFKQFKKK